MEYIFKILFYIVEKNLGMSLVFLLNKHKFCFSLVNLLPECV